MFVTVTTVPNGSHGWAALSPPAGANEYQLASPTWVPWVTTWVPWVSFSRPTTRRAAIASCETVLESTTVATAFPFTNLICVRSTIRPSTPARSTRTAPGLSVSEYLVDVVYGIGTRTTRVRN